MIKNLQKKFILLSMTAFFVVLAVIILSINLLNYSNLVCEADELLAVINNNEELFPDSKKEKDDGLPPFPEKDKFPPKDKPDKDKKAKDLPSHFSPETLYETRYFSVRLSKEDFSVLDIKTDRIGAVSDEEAIAYAKEVVETTKSQGFLSRFRYLLSEDDTGIKVVFLDCGRILDSFLTFLVISILISLLGYIIVFLFIAFFSNRIIRPISESYEKQKRFITDAGHEIKTPLSIIVADVDVLEMEYNENEWTEDIKKQTRRLTDLTNDLIFLSRMEESDRHFTMIEFPLSEVVEETALSFHPVAQCQDKKYTLDIKPLLTLKGDEKAFRQLVSILLDNAFKYSPEQGQIKLSLNQQGKTILFSVTNDTAEKISKEQLPLLFDRFYRTDPSRNSGTGGHGIGLSIAKAIVSAHGGKIQAVAEEDHLLKIIVSFSI